MSISGENGQSTKRVVEKIWLVAEELCWLRNNSDDSPFMGHFYGKLASQVTPEELIMKAIDEVGAAAETGQKVIEEPVSAVFTADESEAIKAVFLLLAKWRDEAKTRSHSSSIEPTNSMKGE